MSQPINIDQYGEYLPIDSSELRSMMVPEDTIMRVERLRELCSFWRAYSSTSTKELVQRCMRLFNVGKSQAYDDIHILKRLIGDLEATTKEFARWRVNQMIEQDRQAARRAGDWRAVASMQKNYIKNNLTDHPDTPDMAFEKIVPLQLEPTDDPSVLGIKVPKNHRARRDKLIKQLMRDSEYAEFTEVKEEDDE